MTLWSQARDFFTRNERWSDLAEAIELRMNHHANDTDEITALHHELGHLYTEKLEERDRGISHLEQVVRIRPEHPDTLDQLIALYESLDRFESLIEAYERKISISKDEEEQISLLFKIAAIWTDNLSVSGNAEDTLLRILRIDRRNTAALQELRTMYRKQQRWDAYASCISDLIDADAEELNKTELYLELANTYNEKLGDSQRAIELFENTLKISPKEKEAIRNLEILYDRHGRWEDYIQLLQKKYDHAKKSHDQYELSKKQGEIYAQQLNSPAMAATHFEAAITHLGDQASSSQEEAYTELLGILRKIYQKTSSWKNLIRVLDRLLESKKSKMDQVDLLIERGEIEENQLEDRNAAAVTWKKILKFLPNHKIAIRKLLNLLDHDKHRKEVIGLFEQLLEIEKDDLLRSKIYFNLAGLYKDNEGEYERHLILSRKANSDNQETLRSLRLLFAKREDWEEAVEILRQEIASPPKNDFNKTEDLEQHLFLGNILVKKLDRPEEAIIHFEKVLEVDSQNEMAIRALAQIQYDLQNWAEAEPFYNKLSFKVGTTSKQELSGIYDDDRFQALLPENLEDHEVFFRQGVICTRLGNHDEAVMRFKQSAGANKKNEKALKALADLLFSQKQWKNVLPVLEELQEVYDANKKRYKNDRISLAFRMGTVHVHLMEETSSPFSGRTSDIDHAELARTFLNRVLKAEPNHFQALQAIIDLELQCKRWPEAVDRLEQLIKNSKDELRVLEAYVQKANLYFDHLGKPDDALACLAEGLQRDSEYQPAVKGLIRIHMHKKNWPEALNHLSQYEDMLDSLDEKADILFEQALIYSREIGDQNRALEILERALEISPHHQRCLEEVAYIHRKRHHWDKLIDHLRYMLNVIPKNQTEELSKIQLEIGDVLLNHMKADDDATHLFREILAKNPNNQQAKIALARIHALHEPSWDEAKAEYTNIIGEDVGNIMGYREFVSLERRRRNADRVLVLGSILEFIDVQKTNKNGAGKDLERLKVSAHQLLESQSASQLSTNEVEEYLAHPKEKGPLRSTLLLLESQLGKIYETISTTAEHTPSIETDILVRSSAKMIGLNEVSIRMLDRPLDNDQMVLPELPNHILLTSGYENISNPNVQRFLVGRSLYYLVTGLLPVLHYRPEELRKFFVALGRHFHPQLDAGSTLENEFDVLHRSFKKILTRNLRRDLRDPMGRVAEQLNQYDFDEWRKSIQHSANRLGLLLCQEPNAALTAIALFPHCTNQTNEEHVPLPNIETASPDERSAWLRQNPEAQELIRFAISDRYLQLRKRLGLSLPEY